MNSRTNNKYLIRNKNGGFTLVELLTALVIISIAIFAVYKTFNVGLLAWNRVIKESESLQNARTFMKLITRDLKTVVAAEPIMIENLAGKQRVYFKFIGTGNSVEMICYSRPITLYWPENFPRRSTMCSISYYFNSDANDETRMYLYRTVKWDNAVMPWKAEETEVFEDIQQVTLSYLDGATNEWADSWDTDIMKKSKSGYHGLLPRCVKIKVLAQSSAVKAELENIDTMVSVTTYER